MPMSQAWAIEHADGALRSRNRAALEAVAATMARYPSLQLEVNVTVKSHSDGGVHRRLL